MLKKKNGTRTNVGATFIEYVLLAALIAIIAIAAINNLGGHSSNTLSNVAGNVENSN